MPTTFVHGLLPTACLAVSGAWLPALTRREWWRLLLASVILGNAPDLDLVPVIFLPSYMDSLHREMGHNVFAIFGLVALGQWLLRRFVSASFTRRQAWGIAGALVVSHIVLDAMSVSHDTSKGGIPLFWPFTAAQWNLPWRIFPGYELDSKLHPLLAHATAVGYWRAVVYIELRNTALIFSAWLAGTAILSALGRIRRTPTGRTSAP